MCVSGTLKHISEMNDESTIVDRGIIRTIIDIIGAIMIMFLMIGIGLLDLIFSRKQEKKRQEKSLPYKIEKNK